MRGSAQGPFRRWSVWSSRSYFNQKKYATLTATRTLSCTGVESARGEGAERHDDGQHDDKRYAADSSAHDWTRTHQRAAYVKVTAPVQIATLVRQALHTPLAARSLGAA